MSAAITSYNMEFPPLLQNPMTTKAKNSIWDKCRMSAVVEPVSQEKKEQIKLLKIYLIEFSETHLKYLPKDLNTERYRNFIKKDIEDPLGEKEDKTFHKCRVEYLDISPGYPICHRNMKNEIYAIQLRPLQKNMLLLGCGNNPTSICYREPTNMVEWEQSCIDYFEKDEGWAAAIIGQKYDDIDYGYTHIHEEYDTIDPNVTMNPTVIGHFGDTEMPFLKSNSYYSIEEEGITLANSKYFQSEYNRLIIQ